MSVLVVMPERHRRGVFDAAAMERLERCGHVHICRPDEVAGAAACGQLTDARVLVTGTGTGRLPDGLLEALPHLEAIVHAAGTLRPIVGVEAYGRGLQLSSQAPTNALPVAEYTLAMILLELKGVRLAEQNYRATRDAIDVDELLADRGAYDRTVGIIGASSIGRRVIELLQPFDLAVLLADPFLSRAGAEQLGATLVDLTTLLRESDLVSMHAPLLESTRGMIGAAELSCLRDGSVFVNTSRGSIVDQDALAAELRTGRFRAVLDVTDPEVPGTDSPLWDLPNVVLTPHVAGSRGRELRRIGARVVEEVERVFRGEPLRFAVSRERYATNA